MSYIKYTWVNGSSCINAARLNNIENGIGDAHEILDARGDSFGKNVGTGANDVAAGNHLHDGRYYTKAEIDAKLANTGTADHNHDTRYYKKSEVDSALQGKSNTGHNHDSRYYTESEVDDKLAGKSNTGHSHNSSYYTKEQINAKILNLQQQINAIKHNIGMD